MRVPDLPSPGGERGTLGGMGIDSAALDSVTRALAGFRGVVSAYLFGSEAEQRQHRDSDVDIAVLLDRTQYPTAAERFEARVRLSAMLAHAVAPRHPDVLVLNDAPAPLAARIVTTGRRLLSRDDAADHAFRRDAQLRAADLEPFLRRTRRLKIDAILRRT